MRALARFTRSPCFSGSDSLSSPDLTLLPEAVCGTENGRNVYLDLGANWANTLRLYHDFYPQKRKEPWEVYAFEASPFSGHNSWEFTMQ